MVIMGGSGRGYGVLVYIETGVIPVERKKKKLQKGCNTRRSTVVPLLSTDTGSIGLDFEVRMGFGIFPMIWSHPKVEG